MESHRISLALENILQNLLLIETELDRIMQELNSEKLASQLNSRKWRKILSNPTKASKVKWDLIRLHKIAFNYYLKFLILYIYNIDFCREIIVDYYVCVLLRRCMAYMYRLFNNQSIKWFYNN